VGNASFFAALLRISFIFFTGSLTVGEGFAKLPVGSFTVAEQQIVLKALTGLILQNFLCFLLYGVVCFENMWYSGLVLHPEVLCMKLWYDYKAKDRHSIRERALQCHEGSRLCGLRLPPDVQV